MAKWPDIRNPRKADRIPCRWSCGRRRLGQPFYFAQTWLLPVWYVSPSGNRRHGRADLRQCGFRRARGHICVRSLLWLDSAASTCTLLGGARSGVAADANGLWLRRSGLVRGAVCCVSLVRRINAQGARFPGALRRGRSRRTVAGDGIVGSYDVLVPDGGAGATSTESAEPSTLRG